MMKRIKAACICQTLHFLLKEDVGHDYAVKLVNEEVEHYKQTLQRRRTQYKILEGNHPAGRLHCDEDCQAVQSKPCRGLLNIMLEGSQRAFAVGCIFCQKMWWEKTVVVFL